MDKLARIILDPKGLQQNLLRKGTPSRVFVCELGIADKVKDELCGRFALDSHLDPKDPVFELRREIVIYRYLGIELFRIFLPRADWVIPKKEGQPWANEHEGPIGSWEDFDRFPWPSVHDIDFRMLDWYEQNLPEDMRVTHLIKLWELVRELFGFERFCYLLYEQLDLIDAVIERVGNYFLEFTRLLARYRCLMAIYGADDFGYKTSTILSPEVIRSKFLTWHKRFSAAAHDRGKLYFLHCCGKIDSIMEDIIDDVAVDAKHSFENVIEPVTIAKRRWGKRLSLLGGLDVDFVARSDKSAIRQEVRRVLDICMPGGGYCLGMGNWVTDYIPLDNYLAVLEESRGYTTTKHS